MELHFFSLIGTMILLERWGIVTSPFAKSNPQRNDTSTTNEPIVQKRHVEELTCYQYDNYPETAKGAQRLKSSYGNHVIVMSLQGGYFTQPNPKHLFNFHWFESEEIINYFNVVPFSSALVNRTSWNGSVILSYSGWQTTVKSFLKESSLSQIQISPTYNNFTHEAQVQVKAIYLQERSIDNYLIIYPTEESIIGYQKEYSQNSPYVEDYIHRNMLRGSLNGTENDVLLSDSSSIPLSSLRKHLPLPYQVNGMRTISSLLSFFMITTQKPLFKLRNFKIININ